MLWLHSARNTLMRDAKSSIITFLIMYINTSTCLYRRPPPRVSTNSYISLTSSFNDVLLQTLYTKPSCPGLVITCPLFFICCNICFINLLLFTPSPSAFSHNSAAVKGLSDRSIRIWSTCFTPCLCSLSFCCSISASLGAVTWTLLDRNLFKTPQSLPPHLRTTLKPFICTCDIYGILGDPKDESHGILSLKKYLCLRYGRLVLIVSTREWILSDYQYDSVPLHKVLGWNCNCVTILQRVKFDFHVSTTVVIDAVCIHREMNMASRLRWSQVWKHIQDDQFNECTSPSAFIFQYVFIFNGLYCSFVWYTWRYTIIFWRSNSIRTIQEEPCSMTRYAPMDTHIQECSCIYHVYSIVIWYVID